MSTISNKREKIALALIGLGAAAALIAGWRLFWFLTDDAFIAFRYISSSQLGHGYVWNPPPFRPVEGYTSFLWVFLLDVVWRVSDIRPPEAANVIALLFSLGSLFLGFRMLVRQGERKMEGVSWLLVVALTLTGVVLNRTFLAWSSSGLETAMFNFFLIGWVYFGVFRARASQKWAFFFSVFTVLIYLTRPDGLLFAVAAVFVHLLSGIEGGGGLPKILRAAWPLVAIPAHLIWRFGVYGVWLPNTFYAKSTGGIALQSGSRYLLSFIIEYSLWIWIAAAVYAGVLWLRRGKLKSRLEHIRADPIAHSDFLLQTIVVATVVIHVLYYTVLVGGDHFEYRVYSHLILLLFVSFAYFARQVTRQGWQAVVWVALFVGASLPIPWAHWKISQSYTTRQQTAFLRISVSEAVENKYPFMPRVGISYLVWFDELQFWLISRAVGTRHQEHKIFYLDQMEKLSFRDETLREVGDEVPVIVAGSVGVLSWVLPHVAIIDRLGLNDYVIARNPILAPKNLMAHARKPPPGYLTCFAEDISADAVVYVPRERIIACEDAFWSAVGGPP